MGPLGWWTAQSRATQRGIAAGVGVAALVMVVAISVARGPKAPPVVAVPVSATATVAPLTATPTFVPTPEPTATGVPTIGTLKELKDRFGEPPDAKRGRIRIPQIGVDAPLGVRSVLPPDLVMHAPSGPADVIMYDFSLDPRYGGSPGAGGNAILSGHVDYSYKLPYAQANYHGRAVFWDVRLLSPGDEIDIVVDGRTIKYAVQWRQLVSAEHGNWDQLLSRNVGGEAITLITCDGAFDPRTLEYNSRTVVRAVRT